MRKKKFIAMALVAMLSLSGLTGCSDKDKADISNKLNSKTTETTKKDDSKADDKTSESKPDNKSDNKSDNKKSDNNSSSDKPANKPSSGNNSSASKPNSNKPADKPSGNTGSNKPADKPSNGNSGNNASKPHEHTWVDHTATRKVPRTVHHDAVYEDVTIPAVTQIQYQCLGCGKWFSSLNDLTNHAFAVQIGAESGDPARCGSGSTDAQREYVITPAHTEHRLVKDAYDETVEDVQTYVDYQECTGCHEHRQK